MGAAVEAAALDRISTILKNNKKVEIHEIILVGQHKNLIASKKMLGKKYKYVGIGTTYYSDSGVKGITELTAYFFAKKNWFELFFGF